jgi:hypothetical protein
MRAQSVLVQVLLCEMATRALPFRGSLGTIFEAVLNRAPSPNSPQSGRAGGTRTNYQPALRRIGFALPACLHMRAELQRLKSAIRIRRHISAVSAEGNIQPQAIVSPRPLAAAQPWWARSGAHGGMG